MHDFREQMEKHRLRLHNPFTAKRVWDRLTDEERSRLGDLESAYLRGGTVWIWAEAKQISLDRATLDLARSFGMPTFDYQELLAEIAPDEVATLNVPAGRPVWNRKLGELSLDGKVIRRISSLSNAKNIVPILDGFEARKWPVSIHVPKRRKGVGEDLGKTVQSLNEGLKEIFFERDGTGAGIRWRVGIRPVRTRSTIRLASQT